MKSYYDEIRLRRKITDGFNFICKTDFIHATLGFHRAPHDFILKIG